MSDLTPQQQRKLDEIFRQPVWDGGDRGELINLQRRLDEYESILARVADVLGCQNDFGMILPNLLSAQQRLALLEKLARDSAAAIDSLEDNFIWDCSCDTCKAQSNIFNHVISDVAALGIVVEKEVA